MVADHRPPGLGDDRRVVHAGLVADGHDAIDNRPRIFFEGVVDGKIRVGLAAVVVDTEPSADIDVLHRQRPADELDVNPGDLREPGVDHLDVADLRSHVAVQQLETVEHPDLVQPVDRPRECPES